MKPISEVMIGRKVTRQQFNALVERVRILSKVKGSGGINVTLGPGGVNLTGGGGGGTASTALFATVIEQPSYADPTAAPTSEAFSGRSWYTVRLLGTTFTDWVDNTAYTAGQSVVYTDNVLYVCTADHTSSFSSDLIPTNTGLWVKSEEIRISYVLGNEQELDSTAIDIRNHIPWFRVGEVVPVTTRVVDDVTRYYLNMTLTYGGEALDSSLRWNDEEQKAQAVFK